jgi:hypothetical protein
MLLPWPVVVDADVLYRNVDFALCRGVPGMLIGQANRGYSLLTGVNLFAATDVLHETIRHLPDIATRRNTTVDAVHAVWDVIISPVVRFVELRPDAVDDPRLDGVDPKDLPSARLAALLAPAVLATDNRKHYKPFALPETKTDAVAKDLFTLGQFGAGTKGIMLFPTLAGAATLEGSKKMVSKLGGDVAAFVGLVLVGGAVYFLRTQRGQTFRHGLADAVEQAGPPLMEFLDREQAADDRVGAFAVEQLEEPNAIALIARRLAVEKSVMTTTEVAAELRLRRIGFPPGQSQQTQTREWLAREPCFDEVSRGHWSLGYHLRSGSR